MLTGSCSRLLQGGGLGLLLLEEEAGSLDAAACASASSASLTMALSRAQRVAASVSSGMVAARDREPAAVMDEQ
jgi:hypothetical protein